MVADVSCVFMWCTLIIFPVVLPVSCMNFVLKTKQI